MYPAVERGHVESPSNSQTRDDSFYWAVKSCETCQSHRRHGSVVTFKWEALDTWKWHLAAAAHRPTQHLLSDAYFTQMGGLWICGPGFMMRGGAAINESPQDKYTLLWAGEEVGTVGGGSFGMPPPNLIWDIHQTSKKGHLRVTGPKHNKGDGNEKCMRVRFRAGVRKEELESRWKVIFLLMS